MRSYFVFLFFLVVTSCEYLNVKKTSTEAILKEELQTFNWKDVDTYPSFLQCELVTLKQEREACFHRVLTLHISEFLQNESIVVKQDISDTIVLNFQVLETGVLKLLQVKIDSTTVVNIPEIESLLYKSLDSLPKIFPATKRGQQVKTEFTLPIIIAVN